MLEEVARGADGLELENLRTAAGILRNWLSELRALAIDNARLSYSFAASGGSDSERAQSLRQRARTLTTQLVAEVDILARIAHHDFEWDQ
jgi:hypothetical protein